MSPLRWTYKSTRVLADELQNQGFVISSTKVGALLKSQGYSLQSDRKTIEGKQHPDQNAQFEHIARRVKARQRCGEPAISVDTKKKEPLGNMKIREKRIVGKVSHPGEDAWFSGRGTGQGGPVWCL